MKAENFIETLPGGASFEMVFVEGGRFMMGSEDEEAKENERPVHEVTLPGFFIGKYPVTQRLWEAIMGIDNDTSRFKGHNRPVERVSWNETKEFIKKLNKLSGKTYRLLTEAEWEYAARGGKHSQGFKFAGNNKLQKVAWFKGNSYGETKPVGLKLPNELGLYDLSGNAFEWVEDQYHPNYNGAPVDGSAWIDKKRGEDHGIRGGSWLDDAKNCRVTFRINYDPSYHYDIVGFRLGMSFQSFN